MAMHTFMSPRETTERLRSTQQNELKAQTVRHHINDEKVKTNTLYNYHTYNRTRQTTQLEDLIIQEEVKEKTPFTKSMGPRSPYGNIALFQDSKPSIKNTLLRKQGHRPQVNSHINSAGLNKTHSNER